MELEKSDDILSYFKKLENGVISSKQLLKYAFTLLNHTETADFNDKTITEFAKSLGLKLPQKEELAEKDYAEYLLYILKQKTKDGRECCEKLAEEGFFDSYNAKNETPDILVFNGKTQAIFDYSECIFEKVYVEVPLDTDLDGKRDLVAVYIRRPKETLKGMKVPAIYVANPYMMGCNEEIYENPMHNVDKDLEYSENSIKDNEEITYHPTNIDIPPERESKGFAVTSEIEEVELECISEWYKYFNTRGFASVYCAGLGTKGSEGINATGSYNEKIWVIAVIDWLCGRRKAFINRTDHIEIKADWCNGSVAMSGKSYLGTLSIGAASTGVEGLKTIIPEAAISNWYNYFYHQGMPVSAIDWQGDDVDFLTAYCRSRDLSEEENLQNLADEHLKKMKIDMQRNNGNYSQFWDERNYLDGVSQFKASVFIVHGISDWNVKTQQCHLLWKELEKYNIPRKMILHQGAHVYIYDLQGIEFNNIMNQWLTYWLYDIDNGAMDDIPNVFIQDNLDPQKWYHNTNWSPDDAKTLVYTVHNGKLCHKKSHQQNSHTLTLVDSIDQTKFDRQKKNYLEWQEDIVLGEEQKPYRLLFQTDPLTDNLIINGEMRVSFGASSDQATGILSAFLIDLGEDKRLTHEQKELEDLVFWGSNAGISPKKDFIFEKNPSKYKIISRGSINIQNRTHNYSKEKIIIDKEYQYHVTLVPTSYTVKKGHKLQLVLLGSDVETTTRPFKTTTYKINESSIELLVLIKG